ncbi:unnamed protein product [[Candida] boidinii]|nr:unnamed protein product [[Candida] boidinii]
MKLLKKLIAGNKRSGQFISQFAISINSNAGDTSEYDGNDVNDGDGDGVKMDTKMETDGMVVKKQRIIE